MTDATDTKGLEQLRAQLDEIDERLLGMVRDRIELCTRIAEYKREHDVPMMQPHRVEAVHEHAANFAAEHGINAGFLRRLYDVIIEETCRVENDVIGARDDQQVPSRLARSARRIDHVAIAVRDLEAAIITFRERYGFELLERRQVKGEISGMNSATMRAGGVTFVLCQGDSPKSNVSLYIEHYGPGVQHIAIEVEGQQDLLDDLGRRGVDLLTKIIHAPGLDQSFTKRDANTGIQVEFVTRTANEGFSDDNVRELFTAMERENVF